jgi:hypothetical protein
MHGEMWVPGAAMGALDLRPGVVEIPVTLQLAGLG